MNLNLTKINVSMIDRINQIRINTSERNIALATSLNNKSVKFLKLILSLTGIFSNNLIDAGIRLFEKSANFSCTLILVTLKKDSFSKPNCAVQKRMQERRVIDMR